VIPAINAAISTYLIAHLSFFSFNRTVRITSVGTTVSERSEHSRPFDVWCILVLNTQYINGDFFFYPPCQMSCRQGATRQCYRKQLSDNKFQIYLMFNVLLSQNPVGLIAVVYS